MEESSSRIKKVLAILLAILFVVSLTTASVIASSSGEKGKITANMKCDCCCQYYHDSAYHCKGQCLHSGVCSPKPGTPSGYCEKRRSAFPSLHTTRLEKENNSYEVDKNCKRNKNIYSTVV